MSAYDCDLYMDLMPLVRDGAVSETTRRVLEEHLEQCEHCRTLFDRLPKAEPTESEAQRTLTRIRRMWFRGTLIVMILGIALSICVTSFRGMTVLNFALMPLVGVAAYIALRSKGWWVPLGVFGVSFLGMLGHNALNGMNISPDAFGNTLLLAGYYGFLCAFGVMIAHLCHFVFARLEEEDPWERMKKRGGRVLLALLYMAYVVGATGLVQVFVGNPLAKASAEGDAAYYVERYYRGHEFTVGPAQYNMKRNGYSVWVYSTSSRDTYFEIYYNSLGIRTGDGYDRFVRTGYTTFWRLNDSYTAAVREILADSPFEPVDYQISLLRHRTEEEMGEFEFDKEYDLNLWAYDEGSVGVTYDSMTHGEKDPAELMLEVRRLMDEAGLGFEKLDLRIRYESGHNYYVILYSEITKENLAQNVSRYEFS